THHASRITLFVLLFALGAGCASGPKPLRPGSAKTTRTLTAANGSSTATTARGGEPSRPLQLVETHELTQPENPAQASSQHVERTTKTALPIPAGSRIQLATGATDHASLSPQRGEGPRVRGDSTLDRIHSATAPPATEITFSAPTTFTTETVEKTGTVLGAAQHDTSRELAAKFANMKPVQWVGLVLLLVAGAFAYFRWWTPAALAGGTGLGLILLAHSLVGNERITLVLLGLAAAILAVFRAYDKGALDALLPDRLDRFPKKEQPRMNTNAHE
ncbi:MAG: hypothetical protein AB1705_28440, partial [Verrucomicrobiota bacterium]